uniref:Uncharacterized protein n=1 Tax=Rhizophora mucronata TaxID=61149 RepID=A0A2P2R143_RHIMU
MAPTYITHQLITFRTIVEDG